MQYGKIREERMFQSKDKGSEHKNEGFGPKIRGLRDKAPVEDPEE